MLRKASNKKIFLNAENTLNIHRLNVWRDTMSAALQILHKDERFALEVFQRFHDLNTPGLCQTH